MNSPYSIKSPAIKINESTAQSVQSIAAPYDMATSSPGMPLSYIAGSFVYFKNGLNHIFIVNINAGQSNIYLMKINK